MVCISPPKADVPIQSMSVAAYRVPTASPEQDGTLDWDSTTIVIVELEAQGTSAIGYGYADLSTACLIDKQLLPLVKNCSAFDVREIHDAMMRHVRNLGQPGIAAMAISIIDTALWDLKSRLLEISLAELLGRCRKRVLAYGSGGFTNYSDKQMDAQLHSWTAEGLTHFKIKIGRDHQRDLERLQRIRARMRPEFKLFVDANGAYNPATAIKCATDFAQFEVSWFEEPVSSDDRHGLHHVREHAPPGMNIAAGEYGYSPYYFRDMLRMSAVDVLQADATRCGGITGFLTVGMLCEAFQVPLSAHTAPTIHAHASVAVPSVIHVEYFYDHARLESLFFEGALHPVNGMLEPSVDRPGLGIELKRSDVAHWLEYQSI